MEFFEQQFRAQYRLLGHEGYYSRVRFANDQTQEENYLNGLEALVAWIRSRAGLGNLYISRNPFTADHNVAGISGFSVDVDQIREPKDRATTEDEQRRTLAVAQAINSHLGNVGVLATSGNGALLLCPFGQVITENVDEFVRKAQRFEKGLQDLFTTSEVRIDATNYAKAVVRVLGCPNAKDADRSKWRYARFVDSVHTLFQAGSSKILERIQAVTVSPDGLDMGSDNTVGLGQNDVLANGGNSSRLGPADRLKLAETSLRRIRKERADEYNDWLRVGIALKEFGPAGFEMWREWSERCHSKERERFSLGDMRYKWTTFRGEQSLTVGTLKYWADCDDPNGDKEPSGSVLLGQPMREMPELVIRNAASIFTSEKQHRVQGYSTGFKWLDESIGGYVPGNVYVWEGSTSVGKTVIAVQSAYNLCRGGKRTLLVTTEMSTDEIRDRFIAAGTGVSASAITSGRTNGSTGLVGEFVRNASRYALSVRESASPKIEELAKAIEQTKAEVLIFDYFQHVDTGTTTRAIELATLARGLEGLSKTYQVPVIVTAQLHEFFDFKTHKRLPSKKNDVKDCKAINDAASCVIVIDWLNSESGDGPVPVRWSVEKNRHGARGETIMKLNRSIPRFEP